jgi:hypothetical protein
MEERIEKPKRGRKKKTLVDVANEKAEYINFMDSFGTIILKNGIAIKVRKMFEYFHQNRMYYMS